MPRSNTIILAIIACLLWSTAYGGIKIGLQYDSPLHFAGIRFIMAGLIILPFTPGWKEYLKMISENRVLVFWTALLQTVVNYALFYLGLNLIPGALGALIAGSVPLFIAVVASMMHKEDPLTKGKMATVVGGISGVFLITIGRQALHLGTLTELVGVLLVVGSNLAAAFANVIISIKGKSMNPLVLSSSSLFLGGCFIYILSVLFEDVPTGPRPAEYWISLAWLTVMASTAFSIWYTVLRRPGVKVSEINLWKFLIPGAGGILSWLIIPGENPDILTFAGILLITISLILFFKFSHPNKKYNEAKV